MSIRRLNTIRRLAEAIDNLYHRENEIIESEGSPTNIKYVISQEGKNLLKHGQYKKNKYSQDICPILNQNVQFVDLNYQVKNNLTFIIINPNLKQYYKKKRMMK